MNPVGLGAVLYNNCMRRNLLLIFGVIVGILLVINSAKRLLTFRTTSEKVQEAENRLLALREESTKLKEQREYTQSEEFREREIRDKLGLAKEGEAVVILPKEHDGDQLPETRKKQRPNYKKWWELFFGG